MERLLVAAKELSEKVDGNETAAGDLLRQCESLQQELKAMKQVRAVTSLHLKFYGEPFLQVLELQLSVVEKSTISRSHFWVHILDFCV